MKKLNLYLIFLIIFVLTVDTYPQNSWVQQNSGTKESIISCYFINSLTGFTAGKSGLILKTNNGGFNWFPVYNDKHNYFTSIFFIDDRTGWALGNINDEFSNSDTNTLVKTTDGGITWIKYIIDYCNSMFYDDVYFTNALTGYITGCNLKKTTDGGLSWNIIYNYSTHEIYFINSSTGWMGSYIEGISKTTDSGQSWIQQSGSMPHHYDSDIFFLNDQTGYFIQESYGMYGILYSTTNSGNNWKANYMEVEVSSITFPDEYTGYMLAVNYSNRKEYLAKTTNKGTNWNFHEIITNRYLTRLFFTTAKTGWIVGDSGLIMKTLNGGVIPVEITLYQNYPNPFNSSTIIKFDLPLSEDNVSFINIDIFNVLGSKITTLVNENYRPGTYEVIWNTSSHNLSSGIYLCRITVQQGSVAYTKTNKMVLLK